MLADSRMFKLGSAERRCAASTPVCRRRTNPGEDCTRWTSHPMGRSEHRLVHLAGGVAKLYTSTSAGFPSGQARLRSAGTFGCVAFVARAGSGLHSLDSPAVIDVACTRNVFPALRRDQIHLKGMPPILCRSDVRHGLPGELRGIRNPGRRHCARHHCRKGSRYAPVTGPHRSWIASRTWTTLSRIAIRLSARGSVQHPRRTRLTVRGIVLRVGGHCPLGSIEANTGWLHIGRH